MDEATKRFNAQLWEVRRLQFHGQPKAAWEVLEQAVASFDGDRTVVEKMARVIKLEIVRRYSEAREWLDHEQEVLEGALPGMFWYTRGVLLSTLRRSGEAVACFQSSFVHADEVDQRACLYFMGRAYRNVRRYADAINSFTQAREFLGYLDESELYRVIGYAEESAYRLLRETTPELIQGPFNTGTDFARVRALTEKAVTAYHQALADPHLSRAKETWYRVGELYWLRHEYQKAIQCYEQVIPSEIRESLGHLKGDRKNPVIFPPVLHAPAEEMQGVAASACYQMTVRLADAGDWQKAIPLYIFLMGFPQLRTSLFVWPALVELCENQGFDKLLLERYRGYVQRPPAGVMAEEWQFAGMLLAEHRRYREALVCYAHALEDPAWKRPGLSRHYQADAYMEVREYRLAIASYLCALLDHGYLDGHGGVWNNLGGAYQAIGKAREAERCFRHV